MRTPPLRVLLADDSAPIRRLLAQTLSRLDGIEVVAEAADGIETLEQVRRAAPDVVVLDLHMPRMSGLKALRQMRADGVPTCVIVLSNETADLYRIACHEAGAQYMFDKTTEIGLVEATLLSLVQHRGVV